MSYEGSIQFLCKKGHVSTFNCYDAPDMGTFICRWCGAGAARDKHIDETNGSKKQDYWPHGLIRKDAEVICECCGSVREPATWRNK